VTEPQPPLFAPPSTSMERRADVCVLLASRTPLGPYPDSVAVMFRASAAAHPDRVLPAERTGDGEGWRTVAYAEARALADSIAQALLDRHGGDRPVMILSGNSVDHPLLTLGALTAGITVVPVSVAYSLQSRDHAKLRSILAGTDPFLVFAEDAGAFSPALGVAGVAAEVVTSLGELTGTSPTDEVERRRLAQTPDNVAKIMFASGSTGTPKGVPTIQFNVPAGYAALVPALERDPALAERFFSRLRLVFFAAAALPQELWDRIEALAARHGDAAGMTTAWGTRRPGRRRGPRTSSRAGRSASACPCPASRSSSRRWGESSRSGCGAPALLGPRRYRLVARSATSFLASSSSHGPSPPAAFSRTRSILEVAGITTWQRGSLRIHASSACCQVVTP
jgi:hypothetical protein